jgi:TIR domain
MTGKWTIDLGNPNIDKFVADHDLIIKDIRTQPFLGSDIRWEHSDDGWEISLYPRLYYDGPADLTVLNALASILRRSKPYFEETHAAEFNKLKREFLATRPELSKTEKEYYSTIIVSFDSAICSSLEVSYLLKNYYFDFNDLRRLVRYRSENFVSHRGALEFLASMAVLKVEGGDTSLFYDKIIMNKWYDMLPVLDKIESCIKSTKALFSDSKDVFNLFFPDFKEQGLLDKIDVLRRNVVGPRDEQELDYDIAISYAGEDRKVAETIAECLRQSHLKVFYDRYYEPELWGKDLHSHLTDVYSKRAKYCLMIISNNYARKQWTNTEREAAQSRAVSENAEYILPLLLDETEIPGLSPAMAYIRIQDHSIEEICKLLITRVNLFK